MSTCHTLTLKTQSPEQTQALARCLAEVLCPGDFLALEGQLGAGKTCFVQGLAEGLGVRGRVASPTFILMRSHPGPVPLFHADAYRLGSGEELLDLGLEDWLAEGVVALEWANLAEAALPADYLQVTISADGDERNIHVIAHGSRSQILLEQIRLCAS